MISDELKAIKDDLEKKVKCTSWKVLRKRKFWTLRKK